MIFISQIQLLADLNLKKTPQLAELVADDNSKVWTLNNEVLNCLCMDFLEHNLSNLCCYDIIQEAEELVTLAPDKMLLKWMNFHLKKAGYKKTVTNFSTDVKVWIYHNIIFFSNIDLDNAQPLEYLLIA